MRRLRDFGKWRRGLKPADAKLIERYIDAQRAAGVNWLDALERLAKMFLQYGPDILDLIREMFLAEPDED